MNEKQKSNEAQKKKLRSLYLRIRRQRNLSQNIQDSARILESLKQFQPIREASVIHTFLSQEEEPDTFNFIQWVLDGGKQVVVPRITPGHPELTHFRLYTLHDLQPGPYGILEISPGKGEPYPLERLELVLVPGIVFDWQGGRVGYGKGFYDRFLAQTPAFRLGLGFSDQIVECVPMSAHDIPLDALITEEGWTVFKDK